MRGYKEIIAAINHLGIGYAVFQDIGDKEGVFRDVNETLARKLGYSPEELINKKSFMEFLTPDTLNLVKSRYKARIKGETVPSHYEFSVITRNKEKVVFEGYIQRITYDGKPATMGFYIDITSRKILEERMEATLDTQKELVTALNYAPEAILITNPEGVIRYVNPAFTKITGYSPGEVIGKKPDILKSGKHDEKFYREFWETISSGKTWEGKFINKRKDGSLYTDHTVVAPVFDEEGKIVAYISIKRDITQEERFKEQIFQAQKMDALGVLASGVAHDFNNILGGILGYVELLKIRFKNDTYVQNILLSMEKGGERAKKLIDKLLGFSKKGGKKEILEVNSRIKNVISIVERTMQKNIRITLDLSKEPIYIMGDSIQIDQVFLNICINAFQAMKEEGGELTIYTATFFPDDEFLSSHYGFQKREYVLVSISDTGCGMDEETKKKIFDPFFTTKENGTGLGLFAAYNIINAHGGKIIVYSEKGKGTTFNIYLPTERKVEYEVEVKEEEIVKGKGTILVIDDERIIREMLKDVLDTLGYNSIFAKDGREGIEKFKENLDTVDLVMIDMNMPCFSGKEVIKLIRELKPRIKTVLVSGFGLNGVLEEVMKEGFSAFLHKPFTLGELSKVLDKLLSNK